jgi:hypothetical protein
MEHTIIDWMFAHPWMTFFILTTWGSCLSGLFRFSFNPKFKTKDKAN